MKMEQAILVLNAGSSSIKFGIYADGDDLAVQWRGQVEGIGTDHARMLARHAVKGDVEEKIDAIDHAQALKYLLAWLEARLDGARLAAAGHRVVHGGSRFSAPVRLTPDIIRQLEALIPLAPLHQPHNLRGIELLTDLRPGLPQVACFDTAFHQGMPRVAQMFALPRELTDSGVRRYGFHGLSYESIAASLPDYLGSSADGRVVVAHLGHGVSLCALHHRKSVATTMSFSPLDGVPMATRSGGIDPSVVFYLHENNGMALDDIEHLLNHRSGMLGVSGQSGDMRDLVGSSDSDARQAVDLFVYHVVLAIGSLSAALGGLDALVFTAGIGENSASIREKICLGCEWLGLQLDYSGNAQNGPCISLPGSRATAWVIPTNEELMIARHTLREVTSM
jgi:acetate kinase